MTWVQFNNYKSFSSKVKNKLNVKQNIHKKNYGKTSNNSNNNINSGKKTTLLHVTLQKFGNKL